MHGVSQFVVIYTDEQILKELVKSVKILSSDKKWSNYVVKMNQWEDLNPFMTEQKNKSQKIWIRFFPERMPTTWSSCSQRQQKIQQRKQHYFFLSGKILCYFEYLEIEPKRRLITMFIDSTWFSVSLSKFKKNPKIPFCSSVKRGRWRTWSPIHGSTRNRRRFIIFEMRIGPIFFVKPSSLSSF